MHLSAPTLEDPTGKAGAVPVTVMRRNLTAAGTVVAALVGFWVAPWAAAQLPLLAVTTALAVGVGAEAHARLHPRFGNERSRRFAGFGIGPAAAALAGALAAGRLDEPFSRAAPFVGAALVAMLLFAQDRELDDHPEQRWTPLAFALVLYLVAFALFVSVYGARDSTLQAGLGTGLCAALVGAALFRPSRRPLTRVWLFAGLTGLGVAELTLVLGTWVPGGLLGGAFLLLYFYIAAGLIQALLEGSLTTRLVVEYGFVGLVGLALIFSTSPLRP